MAGGSGNVGGGSEHERKEQLKLDRLANGVRLAIYRPPTSLFSFFFFSSSPE
jgi:hypothetical protein